MAPPGADNLKWHAFLQDGVMYCSPNCSRPVIAPRRNVSADPFTGPRLCREMFRQPIWWSDVWGWLGFIPLAPSYISVPFEPLCWEPVIEETWVITKDSPTATRHFQMREKDAMIWLQKETLLFEAATKIRLKYRIPGNPPPRPSCFGYNRPHKSRAIAIKMTVISRDWFTIWMGFLSYLIAQTTTYGDKASTPLPCWYQLLLSRGFTDIWLSGLLASTICLFGAHNPRVGVFIQWTEQQVALPAVEWFLSHEIPIWFVWSKKEEDAIAANSKLAYLRPPNEVLQNALQILFQSPSLPLATLVVKRFFNLELGNPINDITLNLLRLDDSSSFVLNHILSIFSKEDNSHLDEGTARHALKYFLASQSAERQQAALDAVSLPSQTMIERSSSHEQIFNDWKDYFTARDKRQMELELVQTPEERRVCEQRERNPLTKSTKMYEWDRVSSSGGVELYVRVRVKKSDYEETLGRYGSKQQRYSSFFNEWDFCLEFAGTPVLGPYDPNYDDDDDVYWRPDPAVQNDSNNSNEPVPFQVPHPSHETEAREERGISQGPMNVDEQTGDERDSGPKLYSEDIVDSLNRVYGYVVALGASLHNEESLPKERIFEALGIVSSTSWNLLSDSEQSAIRTFVTRLSFKSQMVAPHLPKDLDDLSDENFLSLSSLYDFRCLRSPVTGLFVFHSPKSSAVNWSLGVKSARAALYVCRHIISNPASHTLLTVARRLLDRSIPFHTLISMPSCSAEKPVAKPFTPSSFRREGYKFTLADFDGALLYCKAILRRPEGRAAILRGGILSRIAREFLSVDDVLTGPSVEVTLHHCGFVMSSEHEGENYWDDDLTDDEIATLCGTYVMYTGHGHQTKTISWFPPPSVWDESAFNWLEWTERDEIFFSDLVKGIEQGKIQPLTRKQWRDRLRGHAHSRNVIENNVRRSNEYLLQKLSRI